MAIKLPYATKNGKMIYIGDVPTEEKGLKCGCFCPYCGEKLIARIGDIRTHHFAHSFDCNPDAAVQTMIHMLAKEMISEFGELYLPKHMLSIYQDGLEIDDFEPIDMSYDSDPNEEYFSSRPSCYTSKRSPREKSCWNRKLLGDPFIDSIKGGTRKIDSARLEKRLEGIVPDIILDISGNELIVEIAVTHFVDKDKLEKIRKHNYAALEVNLSKFYKNWKNTQDLSGLKEILLQHSELKKWIHSPNDEIVIQREIKQRQIEKERQAQEDIEQAEIKKRKEQYRAQMQKVAIERVAQIYEPANYQTLIEKHAQEISSNKFWRAMLKKYQFKADLWPDIIDIPIHGEIIYGCDRKVWQGAIFFYLVYNHEGVSCAFADERLSEWMKETLYKDLIYTSGLKERGLPTHADVLKQYFRTLMDNDIIECDTVVKWRKFYKVKMDKIEIT